MSGTGTAHSYETLYSLPHHQAADRPHMSLNDRAAQFAPFAALTGYEDLVRETARSTEPKILLTESETERLNRDLVRLAAVLRDGMRPVITVTCFEPDLRKEGGTYRTLSGCALRVDPLEQKLVLSVEDGDAGAGTAEVAFAALLDLWWEGAEDLEPEKPEWD